MTRDRRTGNSLVMPSAATVSPDLVAVSSPTTTCRLRNQGDKFTADTPECYGWNYGNIASQRGGYRATAAPTKRKPRWRSKPYLEVQIGTRRVLSFFMSKPVAPVEVNTQCEASVGVEALGKIVLITSQQP
jgi:hypothetical protein